MLSSPRPTSPNPLRWSVSGQSFGGALLGGPTPSPTTPMGALVLSPHSTLRYGGPQAALGDSRRRWASVSHSSSVDVDEDDPPFVSPTPVSPTPGDRQYPTR